MNTHRDAFGHALYDYYRGRGRGYEIIERDDGLIDISGGKAQYLADYTRWPPHHRAAMRFVRGKVLDIGCGAGRHAIYLQRKGFDALGIDVSPLAVKVSRLRGLRRAKILSITRVTARLGIFDTVLMLGNNFGLFQNPRRAHILLKRLYRATGPQARIIAESLDLYRTTDPNHLWYHRRNRRRGRMAGQVRLRVRYRKFVGAWFDYLFVSKREMQQILASTGWRVRRFIDEKGPRGLYIAIIEKMA